MQEHGCKGVTDIKGLLSLSSHLYRMHVHACSDQKVSTRLAASEPECGEGEIMLMIISIICINLYDKNANKQQDYHQPEKYSLKEKKRSEERGGKENLKTK